MYTSSTPRSAGSKALQWHYTCMLACLSMCKRAPAPAHGILPKFFRDAFGTNHPKQYLPAGVRPAQDVFLAKKACMQGGTKLDDTTSQEACDAGVYSQPVMEKGLDNQRGHLPASVRLAQDILLAKEAVGGENGHRAHDGDPGQALRQRLCSWGLHAQGLGM